MQLSPAYPLLVNFRKFARQPLLTEFPQVAVMGIARRHFIVGQVGGVEVKLHPAACGYRCGVLHRFRHIVKERRHLLRGLQVKLVGLKLHPVLLVNSALGLYAQQHVLRGGIALFDIMDVVGGGQCNARLPRQLYL